MSHSVQDVFNLLSADPKFISRLEDSIKNIMKDGKVDQYDVPEIVFIITDAYNQMSSLRLSSDDLPKLFKMIYSFIIDKLNLIPEDKKPEFERLVDSALKLVMMQPVVNQVVTSCFAKIFPCFRTQSQQQVINKTESQISIKPDPIALQIIKDHTQENNQI
jgi:hypothetical protein